MELSSTIKPAIKAVDKLEVTLGAKGIGEVFLDLGYITKTQLNHALEYQEQKGGRLGWILATLGYINRLELFEGLARYCELPFETNLSYINRNIDKGLIPILSHEEITDYQTIPFQIKGKTLFVLTADPNNHNTVGFLSHRFEVDDVQQIVITDLDLMKISQELNRDTLLDNAIHGLLYLNPSKSANKVVSVPQLIFGIALIAGIAIWLSLNAGSFLVAILLFMQIFFVIPVLFKFTISLHGFVKYRHQPNINSPVRCNEVDLPVYTILVAVYKEAAVIGKLIQSLKKLDYPEDKLDIILLMEEDDKETFEAAKIEKPPVNWRFLILPNSIPKTKPKALNYGLRFAKGEYLTIYDAEDIPEPDQLKKAVAAFRNSGDDNYICFQARLNYFNKDENFLTKMFTLEYSGWFDCLLPGLDRAKLPIPLGGTSNHFDIMKLKQIGAWDPFNVTEDADLGIRASTEGYKVGVIDSTTYEEANSNLKNWIRQRSRWVKGYIQTMLVHSRNPIKTIKAMGLLRWLSYILLIGGTPASFLLCPIMWLLFAGSLFLPIFKNLYIPTPLLYLTWFNLVISNSLVILISVMGLIAKKHYDLIPFTLLCPLYWLLQSVGAYKGTWQLLTKPFYWEKTTHGITKYNIGQQQSLIVDKVCD
jgi:glycosyltransferase XagB